MKKAIVLCFSLLWLAVQARSEPSAPCVILTSEEKVLLEKEEQHGWKLVHWAADTGQALELARASRKPILVFLSVGELGKPESPNL